MSVAEHRAVLSVISDGREATEVAGQFGVSRQTMHTWLRRYEEGGMEGLVDRKESPRAAAAAASSRSATASRSSPNRPAFTSSVIAADACPSIRCTPDVGSDLHGQARGDVPQVVGCQPGHLDVLRSGHEHAASEVEVAHRAGRSGEHQVIRSPTCPVLGGACRRGAGTGTDGHGWVFGSR